MPETVIPAIPAAMTALGRNFGRAADGLTRTPLVLVFADSADAQAQHPGVSLKYGPWDQLVVHPGLPLSILDGIRHVGAVEIQTAQEPYEWGAAMAVFEHLLRIARGDQASAVVIAPVLPRFRRPKSTQDQASPSDAAHCGHPDTCGHA